MMVEKAAVGKREKEGEGGRRSGKARVADQTAGMTERASTPLSNLSVCRIHKGETKRLRRRVPKIA
jgi:hypothetical protein